MSSTASLIVPTCSVCIDHLMVTDGKIIAAPCGHAFHAACLRQWFLSNAVRNAANKQIVSRCPMCNGSLNVSSLGGNVLGQSPGDVVQLFLSGDEHASKEYKSVVYAEKEIDRLWNIVVENCETIDEMKIQRRISPPSRQVAKPSNSAVARPQIAHGAAGQRMRVAATVAVGGPAAGGRAPVNDDFREPWYKKRNVVVNISLMVGAYAVLIGAIAALSIAWNINIGLALSFRRPVSVPQPVTNPAVQPVRPARPFIR